MNNREAINGTLRILGLVGFDGISVEATSAAQALRSLLQKSTIRSKDYGRLLVDLKRRGLVDVSIDGTIYRFNLTPAGVHRLQKVIINGLAIPQPKKWDGKWRVVTFDIPVRYSQQRAYFTKRLQLMGLVMLQKSFWVYPHPCFEQIDELANHYNLQRYCTFMEVDRLDDLSSRRLHSRFTNLIS